MKYLTLIALIIASQNVQADFWTNCTNNGGTIITANSYGNDKGGLCHDPNDSTKTNNCNGKSFCASNNPMNWWSAHTWCEAVGGKLASFYELCPTDQPIGDYSCANLKAIPHPCKYLETATSTSNSNSIHLQQGRVDSDLRTYGNACAICKE